MAAVIATVLSLACMGAASPPPRAVPLKPLKDADAKAVDKVCALPGIACGPSGSVALYTGPGGANDYWAIGKERPVIAHLARSGQDWRVIGAWDFTAYDAPSRHEAPADAAPDSLARRIYPALYPVARGQWAAAVLTEWSEAYSGGGGLWDLADFVPLRVGAMPPPVARAPFSCSKIVRACFSERDYKTSPHCHDEWSGWLTLSFDSDFGWKGVWHETKWPAGRSKSAQTTSLQSIRPDPSSGAKVNFCDVGD